MKNYVITIARGFGSGGKDIATRLGEALGIPCYERQILTMASDQSGIDESVFVETDEKSQWKRISFPMSMFSIFRQTSSGRLQIQKVVLLWENVQMIFCAATPMSSVCILKHRGQPV